MTTYHTNLYDSRVHIRPHRGTTILTLGVVGFFIMGLILGPIAWCLGNADLRAMDRGEMDDAGRELTRAGRICGIVVTFLNVFALALGVGLLLVILTGAAIGAI